MVITKTSTLRCHQVKITQFMRAGATGKMPVKTGWPIFFGNSVRVIEQRFDISFRKVLELQK